MATGRRQGQRWRQAVVWLHVLTSVGWMAQALALASMLVVALGSTGSQRWDVVRLARHLDITLLAPLANASAFTGLLLAAATAWGLTRHWWVLVKFAITLIQLYIGIFVLSGALDGAVDDAAANSAGSVPALAVGAGLMAGAIAYQAWLSVAKPFGRTGWTAGHAKAATAPRWVFTMGVGAVVGDLAIAVLLGYPMPACSVLALVVAAAHRFQTARGVGRAASA